MKRFTRLGEGAGASAPAVTRNLGPKPEQEELMLCFICRFTAVENICLRLRSTIGPAGWARVCIPCAIRHAFITSCAA